MAMREDGDGKTWEYNIMTKYVGNIFWETPCAGSLEIGDVCRAGVLVFQFFFGGRCCLGGTLVVCP